MSKVILIFLLCCISTGLFAQRGTYFTYSDEELATLNGINSSYRMDEDELKKWDAITAELIKKQQMNFYDLTRLYTYLYVAQADVAFLSYRLTGEFSGSFDPISSYILSYVTPNYRLPALYLEDLLSERLAQLVFSKVKERAERENNLLFEYLVPSMYRLHFSAGLSTAKWIPWYAKPAIAYWPPPPPHADDPEWREQIKLIQEAQDPMTEEKKQIIYRWAGLTYPGSDDWRGRVNAYLFCHHISLLKALEVRSVVMVGLYDCVIAYGGCKYHYLVVRPQVYDPSVVYEIPVPQHPSYPSGHSTESTLTATLMSYFFPNDSKYWHHLADQCCLSRIWAGIHYPLDDQGGQICGKKVAEKEIEVFKKKLAPKAN